MIAPRTLVLWDIDHTLIQSGGLGREMYERAFVAAFDRPFVKLADVTGRTELDIVTETLELHGIAATEESVRRMATSLVRSYESGKTELAARGRALPGTREALSALAANPAVYQGVVTGNLRAVARIKLAVFELDSFVDFDAGGYGDDHTDRAQLVAIARARAREKTGTTFDTVVIGDTPRDVEAALIAGVRVIAVASGRSSVAELRDAGATEVMPDLLDLDGLLRIVAR